MTERRALQTREPRFGALALVAALTLALVIVGIRLSRDGGQEGAQVPPTSAPIPAPPPTLPPATPPAVATPSPPAAGAVVPADGRNVVCLDPGHGGSDLGNVRVENDEIVLREKDFTLAHALMLGERLRARGFEVVFTRTSDSEVNPGNLDVNLDGTVAAEGGEARTDQLDDLQARVNICNAAGADLLVSIHYNGAENEFLEGYEVWYNDERPFSDRSQRFAELIHAQLGERLAGAGYPAVDRGIGLDDHVVTGPARPGELDPSRMPGAVVEGLFLSNEEDAAFAVTDAADDALVGAYERAIVDYFVEFPG